MYKRMMVLLISTMVAVTSWAGDFDHQPNFTVNDIHYFITGDNTVSVTYKPGTANANHKSYSGEVTIPPTVSYDDKTYTVTAIGEGAFHRCDVTAVHLPSTVTLIQRSAFSYSAMTEITLSTGLKRIDNYAFEYTQMEHILLPAGLEEIGIFAFRGNTALQDIVIPSSVTSMDEGAFYRCSGLKALLFTQPSNISTIGRLAFYQCGLQAVAIPASVSKIGDSAFNGNQIEELSFGLPGNLKTLELASFMENPLTGTITLPASIETIEKRVFASCGNSTTGFSIAFEEGSVLTAIGEEAFDRAKLNSIALPSSLRTLADKAFYQCDKMEELVLPDGLETIGISCFEGTKLTKANIPASVTAIGERAFQQYASSLTLELASSTTDVGNGAFYKVENIQVTDLDAWMRIAVNKKPFFYVSYGNKSYGKFAHVYHNGSLVTDYVLPDGIESVDENSFYQNSDIKSVTFPNTLKTIGKWAFYSCTALETVVFGNSVQEVGDEAFRYDTAIKTVDVGNLTNWCGISFYASTSNPITLAARIVLGGEEVDELSIPTAVTSIGNFAFNGCLRFSSVRIPNNVTSIGAYAFNGCTDLETVTFGSKPKLATIGESAFAGTSIQTLALPATVSSLGASAFANCKQLRQVNVPGLVKELGANVFNGCSSLQQLTLEEGLETIGIRSFSSCSSLQRVDIPTSLTTMGSHAFSGSALNIYIKDLAAWCRVAFANNDMPDWCNEQHLYLNDELVKDLVIPDGITSLPEVIFSNAVDIETLTIPASVTTIGQYCFWGCYGLHTIHVSSTLESVGKEAFDISNGLHKRTQDAAFYISDLANFITSGMAASIFVDEIYYGKLYINGEPVQDLVIPEGITTVTGFRSFDFRSATLPASLQSIEVPILRNANAAFFDRCRLMKTIYCRGKFAPNFTGYYASYAKGIGGPDNLEAIYVPAGRSNNYKSKWSANTDIIFEASETVRPTGTCTLTSLTEALNAHDFVYDSVLPCIDMSEATLDETVTAEAIQDIADKGSIVFLPEGTGGIEGTNIVANGHTPKLILNGGTDFAAPYDFEAETLIYNRKFSASATEATTICLPYNTDKLPAGLKAYRLTGQDDMGNVVFEEVETLEANMPYVISATMNVENLTGEKVQVKATPAEMPNTGNTAFEFRGCLSAMSHEDAADMEAYILGTDMQWQAVSFAEEDVNIPAGSAYLVPVETASATFASVLNATTPMEYVTGDANVDGKVTITDAVGIVDYILGNPSAGFAESAADTNKDGSITITDAVGVVDIILNEDGE